MRIISGTRKGMRLQSPAGRAVRPTPDRVREALMSILGGRFDGERVLDLFAGTGAVGLECASRGCGELVLVERAAEALVALKDNVARFGSQPPISVMSVGMRRAIEVLADRGARFDLIYLDPPYGHGLELEALERLLQHGLLALAGQVCARPPQAHAGACRMRARAPAARTHARTPVCATRKTKK